MREKIVTKIVKNGCLNIISLILYFVQRVVLSLTIASWSVGDHILHHFLSKEKQHEQLGPKLPALDDPHNHVSNHIVNSTNQSQPFFFPRPIRLSLVSIFIIKNVDELSPRPH